MSVSPNNPEQTCTSLGAEQSQQPLSTSFSSLTNCTISSDALPGNFLLISKHHDREKAEESEEVVIDVTSEQLSHTDSSIKNKACPIDLSNNSVGSEDKNCSKSYTLRLERIFSDSSDYLLRCWKQCQLVDAFFYSSYDEDLHLKSFIPAHRFVICAYSAYCLQFFESYPKTTHLIEQLKTFLPTSKESQADLSQLAMSALGCNSIPVMILPVPHRDLQDLVDLMYKGILQVSKDRIESIRNSANALKIDKIQIQELNKELLTSSGVFRELLTANKPATVGYRKLLQELDNDRSSLLKQSSVQCNFTCHCCFLNNSSVKKESAKITFEAKDDIAMLQNLYTNKQNSKLGPKHEVDSLWPTNTGTNLTEHCDMQTIQKINKKFYNSPSGWSNEMKRPDLLSAIQQPPSVDWNLMHTSPHVLAQPDLRQLSGTKCPSLKNSIDTSPLIIPSYPRNDLSDASSACPPWLYSAAKPDIFLTPNLLLGGGGKRKNDATSEQTRTDSLSQMSIHSLQSKVFQRQEQPLIGTHKNYQIGQPKATKYANLPINCNISNCYFKKSPETLSDKHRRLSVVFPTTFQRQLSAPANLNASHTNEGPQTWFDEQDFKCGDKLTDQYAHSRNLQMQMSTSSSSSDMTNDNLNGFLFQFGQGNAQADVIALDRSSTENSVHAAVTNANSNSADGCSFTSSNCRKRSQNTYHAAKYRDRRRQRIEQLFNDKEKLEKIQNLYLKRMKAINVSIGELIKSRTQIKSKSGETFYQCPVCRKTFLLVDRIRHHLIQDHDDLRQSTEQCPLYADMHFVPETRYESSESEATNANQDSNQNGSDNENTVDEISVGDEINEWTESNKPNQKAEIAVSE